MGENVNEPIYDEDGIIDLNGNQECTNCSKFIKISYKFCPHCGKLSHSKRIESKINKYRVTFKPKIVNGKDKNDAINVAIMLPRIIESVELIEENIKVEQTRFG